jgi:hypothetical protein
MTPDQLAELFTKVGRELYGEQFTAPMATLLSVDRNTVGKWASGKSRIPPRLWPELTDIIDHRQRKLTELRRATRLASGWI